MPFDREAIIDPQGLVKQGYKPRRKLDLVIVQDTTRSQEAYIDASLNCCVDVCLTLKQSGLLRKDDGLRVALLAFRDHEPEDQYLIKEFGGFTDKIETIVTDLKGLTSFGGGDGPEAITTALDKALQLSWREGAVKLVVLITDAPPHAIGEKDDYYEDEEPGGLDPLSVVAKMAEQSIALLIVACEPTLSNAYNFAHDFYMALAEKAGGSVLPLVNINMLAPVIVGFALEQVEIDSLASLFGDLVNEGRKQGMSEKELASGLHSVMQERDTKICTVSSTSVYVEPKDAAQYVAIWTKATDLQSGRREHKRNKTKRFQRIPPQFIGPKEWRPTDTRIPIKLKNLWNPWITYSYRENGQEFKETLKDGWVTEKDIEFYAHVPYIFTLWSGSDFRQVSRTFAMQGDWDLSQEFQRRST